MVTVTVTVRVTVTFRVQVRLLGLTGSRRFLGGVSVCVGVSGLELGLRL